MAPEYPYPTPVDDCYTVTQYILKNANEFGCDSGKIVLAGDSAGKKIKQILFLKIWI